MDENWHEMGSCAIGRAIGAGEIDPCALTEMFLERIAHHPESGRIFTHVTAERARLEARDASTRAKAGTRRSLLDGVPISWKDLFDIADLPTEGGSALLKGAGVAAQDCEALIRANAGGLVTLGKTHMSEFAFSGLGVNPITATPPNINAPNRAPGGSSSGAGASIAFGLSAGAIGSDTGGSVRIPAAWNDLVGFKTTAGLIPCDGSLALCPKFDTIGPLGRTVEDVSALFATLADCSPPDLRESTLKGAHFLALPPEALSETAHEIETAFSASLERLMQKGARISIKPLPVIQDALALGPVLYSAQSYASRGRDIERAPDKMFPRILERFRAGENVKASDYLSASWRLQELRKIWQKEVAGFDGVLLPSCPIMPPETERLLNDEEYYRAQNLLALRNTRIANLLKLCSITLPTGVKSVGLMLCGQAFGEQKLLRTAKAVENALQEKIA